MLRILKNLFSKNTEQKDKAIGITKHTRSVSKPSNKFPKLDALRHEARQYGHSNYPFLSKDYSPNSRVPSIDLTPFIADRLNSNDIDSVIVLMREVLSANPGIGIGPEWIDKEIKEIINIDFANYLKFYKPEHYNLLKAMWIIASKGGGGREFWLTEDIPRLFAWRQQKR